jgi:quercetin dioxygenase-like cupin family protein
VRQNQGMWVKRMSQKERVRATHAIFRGEAERQSLIGDDVSRQLYLGEITFKDGGANKWHVHSSDQILVITDGEGIVADESEERQVGAGDVAFIPANTKHWHGARPGKDMTHLAILGPGKTTVVE